MSDVEFTKSKRQVIQEQFEDLCLQLLEQGGLPVKDEETGRVYVQGLSAGHMQAIKAYLTTFPPETVPLIGTPKGILKDHAERQGGANGVLPFPKPRSG